MRTAMDEPGSVARREAVIDRAIHLLGIGVAVIGSVVLLWAAGSAHQRTLMTGVMLYMVGLFAMLVCSALYHGVLPSPRKALLRRFDHAAIFLLIAGTYSPFMVGATDDPAIEAVYVAVWASAVIGVVAKLLFAGRFERLSVVLYLALGWSVVIVIGRLIDRLPPSVLWLIAVGGVLYSAGVAFHLWKRLPYQKAIWHGFVVSAAATHFTAVLTYVVAT